MMGTIEQLQARLDSLNHYAQSRSQYGKDVWGHVDTLEIRRIRENIALLQAKTSE